MVEKLSSFNNEAPYRRAQYILTGATTGDWIILDSLKPPDHIIAAVIIPIGETGEGYFEFTAEDLLSVQDGTVQGVKWAAGNVRLTRYNCFPSGITALRPVNVTGTNKYIISI